MTPQEASRRARDLWARLPTRRLGRQLEPLVVAHVALVRQTVAASPPPQAAYCLALNPVLGRGELDEEIHAYGLQTDREALISRFDALSAWNATLFDTYVDAVQPVPEAEPEIRKRLAGDGIVAFDYWLLTEVARRLNDLRSVPEHATPDFVYYAFDHDLSDDFQLGLAYSTPSATYAQLAASGLVVPENAVPGANWDDFELRPD